VVDGLVAKVWLKSYGFPLRVGNPLVRLGNLVDAVNRRKGSLTLCKRLKKPLSRRWRNYLWGEARNRRCSGWWVFMWSLRKLFRFCSMMHALVHEETFANRLCMYLTYKALRKQAIEKIQNEVPQSFCLLLCLRKSMRGSWIVLFGAGWFLIVWYC